MHIEWAGNFYRFDGWLFEVNRYIGPHPLNKNGDPRQTPPGRKFWRMWDKFNRLPPDQQNRYLVWSAKLEAPNVEDTE